MLNKRNLLQEIAMNDLLSTREEKIVRLVAKEFSQAVHCYVSFYFLFYF